MCIIFVKSLHVVPLQCRKPNANALRSHVCPCTCIHVCMTSTAHLVCNISFFVCLFYECKYVHMCAYYTSCKCFFCFAIHPLYTYIHTYVWPSHGHTLVCKTEFRIIRVHMNVSQSVLMTKGLTTYCWFANQIMVYRQTYICIPKYV